MAKRDTPSGSRSSKVTKVYVARDSYVWRDDNGKTRYIPIPDPVVRPKGTSVRGIRKATRKAAAGSALRNTK